MPKAEKEPKREQRELLPEETARALDLWRHATFSSLFQVDIDFSLVEDVFVEVLTLSGTKDLPMVYLESVSRRAYSARRVLKRDLLYEAKNALLGEVVRFCASYGLICFQIPEMVLNNSVEKLVMLFLEKPDTRGFLGEILQCAAEQDFLVDVLNYIFPTLSARMHGVDLTGDYALYLGFWEFLVGLKPVCSVFSQVAGFWPPDPKNSLDYEHKTLLGPLFKLSPLQEAVSVSIYAPGATTVIDSTPLEVTNQMQTTQTMFKSVFDRLWFIADKLVRGSAQTRGDVMKWLADLVNASHLRTGSHANSAKLASDALMFNLSVVLVRLSLPFLGAPYLKIDKIDMDYFGKQKLVDVEEEPRINASAKDALEHYEGAMDEDTNFISDCFFLCLTYFQYGIGGLVTNHARLKREIKAYAGRITELGEGNPLVARIVLLVNVLKSRRYAIEAIGFYRAVNTEIFDFVVGAAQFMLRCIDPSHKYPAVKVQIPFTEVKGTDVDNQDYLRSVAPVPWKFLPEYVLGGLVDWVKFVISFENNPLQNNEPKSSLFAEFATVLLRCPELVGNPHTKANIVEIFFVGCLKTRAGPGFFTGLFGTNELISDNLLYALLDIYVMIEKTGSLSQFYDKFNTRYYITEIVEELWLQEKFKRQLSGYSKHNVEFFIRFIARMLNDTTYLIDEAFNELNTIHRLQVEIEQESTEERELELASAEAKAKLYMSLANQTMKLFKLFTKQVPEGFTIDELVDRLAGMLDYNLNLMVGPKCLNLKVKEPEKYLFDPKKMLSDICEVFVNLGKQERFVVAVARDGRLFDVKLFEKACGILLKRTFVNAAVIEEMRRFGERAEEQRLKDEAAEAELGEVPDEFLDPLMYTLMEDPVVLPGSKVTIDRLTIKAHLLSDPTDPFNRMPLKLEDVAEDQEMRAKIAQWKAGKR